MNGDGRVAVKRFPDFFIVGAPKCGTTALHYYLSGHPSVFMPQEKEPQFFSSDIAGLRRHNDLPSYLSLFAGAPKDALIGEASPVYLFSRQAIPAILTLRPDAKFIVMMRNPVEMARAFHAQMLLSVSGRTSTISRLRGVRKVTERKVGDCLGSASRSFFSTARFVRLLRR
jgi:hypothetical protein